MKTLKQQRGASQWLSLAAIVVVGAIAYFWAKPAHQGTGAANADAAKPAVSAAAAAPNAAAAPSASAAPAASSAPAAAIAPAAAKVFFAKSSAALPADADKTLGDIVAFMKANAGAKATISGYHDPKGNKAANEELAKNRAKAVREALRKAGVAGDNDARIVMQKPAETAADGSVEEARRVEVSVQ